MSTLKISSCFFSLALLLFCGSALCQASVSAPTVKWLRENYTKREVFIPARDGVRLHTSVYEPADSLPHPVILLRTPYGVGPYGEQFAGSRQKKGPNL